MAIDFNDTLQPAQFQVCFNASKRFMVSIAAPVGELLQPNMLSKNDFLALKGQFIDYYIVCHSCSLNV